MGMTERRWMTALGALQGLALWLLTKGWPDEPRWAAVSAATLYFICAGGLVLHLARSGRDTGRLVGLAIGVGAAFGAIALWIGWQLPPDGVDFDGDDARIFSWAVGASVAIFVLGPFVQIYQRTGRARFPYPELYRFSWNNFFIASLAGVYLGAFWAVLLVWAQLFELIGIDFFENLFTQPFVAFAVTGGALGYGMAAARENERVIGALRGITQALFRAVLPVMSVVTLGFLATLPFTGLEVLFSTSSAASVLLWWLVLGVVLLNAVYVDGSEAPPYATLARRVVEAGVLLTPVLAGLALYALVLRIDQHGLTPQRVFATLLALILALYAVGYAAAVILHARPWLGHLRPVNVAIAWVWIVLAFVVHTPLLDPLGWSLRSQLQRLESGSVEPMDFDFAYLRFHLGHQGAEALEQLVADTSHPPDVRTRLELANTASSYWEWKRAAEGAATCELSFERIPTNASWPEGLRIAIERETPHQGELRRCRTLEKAKCIVTPRDLDGDGSDEELVFTSSNRRLHVFVFDHDRENGWQAAGRMSESTTGHLDDESTERVLEAVRAGELEPIAPVFPDLQVDGHQLRFDPF